MSNYVWGTNLSYNDYLQAESFESALRGEISSRTRSIIASNEELLREHIATSQAVSDGFEQVSFDLQTISQGVTDLNATFQWGFCELLLAVGRVNDSLTELVKVLKTPSQTWAYEQFDIARDAFQKGLYQEALEYLGRAINGYAGNTGYKLEYRFHYLMGTIRMGRFSNPCPEVVNLSEAERAFLLAARYGLRDHRKEAACAFLAAGWTAYCQGNMQNAKQTTEEAITLDHELAEAHFQLAKIQMHIDDPASSLVALRRAIELDQRYSIKAGTDDDFKRYKGKVDGLLEILRHEAKEKAKAEIAASGQLARETEQQEVPGFPLTKFVEIESAKKALFQASKEVQPDTYYGYLNALTLCRRASVTLRKAVVDYSSRAGAEARQEIGQIDARISAARVQDWPGRWVTLALLGPILFFVVGCVQCGSVYQANSRQEALRKDALNRAFDDLRQKGYDPNKITMQKARELGFKVENLPPPDTGSSALGTWFAWFFLGSFSSIVGAILGADLKKSSSISALEKEKSRLQQTEAKIRQVRLP
jgi:tetratricopeptide (TPR) repeat protein